MSSIKKIIFLITLVGLDVVACVIGFKFNEQFFNIGLMGLITVNVTIVVSFYIVQNLTAERRKNDYIAKTLDDIIKDLSNENLFNHNNNIQAALSQRYISNRLLFVSEVIHKSSKEEIEYIKDAFEKMQTFYGDHINIEPDDPFYEKEKVNILIKINKIQLMLYGNNILKKK